MNEYEHAKLTHEVRTTTIEGLSNSCMELVPIVGIYYFISFAITAVIAIFFTGDPATALTVFFGVVTAILFFVLLGLQIAGSWLRRRWIRSITDGIQAIGEINCRAADESITKTQDVLEKLNAGGE